MASVTHCSESSVPRSRPSKSSWLLVNPSPLASCLVPARRLKDGLLGSYCPGVIFANGTQLSFCQHSDHHSPLLLLTPFSKVVYAENAIELIFFDDIVP